MIKIWKKPTAALLAASMIVSAALSSAGPVTAQAAPTGETAVLELSDKGTPAPQAWGVVPSQNQYEYQKQELAAFCHFGMNTYTEIEWGSGTEKPSDFQLTKEFDAETLVSSLHGAGFKKLIVTAKHHDGFCIWRSAYTDHDLESTGYEGDVLKEISAACTRYDMDMGLYLSPWDMNSPAYGYRDANGNATDKDHDVLDYNEYYNNQLQEILGNDEYGNNGHFVEVWMDGAKGDGFMAQDYDFQLWFDTIQKNEGIASGKYDSDCMLFGSGAYTTVYWIGNESGFANEETWSKIKVDKDANTVSRGPGADPGKGTKSGWADGNQWAVPEADTKITSGWFWGPGKKTPESLEKLSNIYFDTVGHGAALLLNVPPNQEGTVDQAILDRVAEFGENIDETFSINLAAANNVTVTASEVRGNDTAFSPENVLDGNDDTYWTMEDGSTTGSLTIDLGATRTFDVVSMEEAIQLGQRISSFRVEYQNQGGEWKTFAEGTTIGPKKLCRQKPVKADKVRINITGSHAVPLINEVGIYKASEGFELGQAIPDGLENIDIADQADDGIGFAFGDNWTDESGSQFVNGTNKWANPSSEVTMKFHGTKAWILGTLDPNHGTADIYIDGAAQPAETINTNAEKRLLGQKIYETPELEDGDHTIRLVVKDKSIGIEAMLALNNGGKGMFEIGQLSYSVPENTENQFLIRRIGGSKGEAKVIFQDQPGTAVQSEYLPTNGMELTFAEGETEKTVTVVTKRQTQSTGDLYFFIELVNPTEGSIVGFNASSRVTIIDSDKITREELSALVDFADSKAEENFKQDTWSVFAGALKAARIVLANAEAAGFDFTQAYMELQSSMEGLQMREPYSQEDRFAFPTYKNQQKVLEAEFFELDPIDGDYVRITDGENASNGKEVNWFESGNKIILHYTTDKAGTYKLTATYRSGRSESAPNAFEWSGTHVTAGSRDVFGPEAEVFRTITLPIEITEAGEGDLVFTASSKAGPVIDKFVVEPDQIEYTKFKIEVKAGEHGSISNADLTELYQGADQKFVITPDGDYVIKDVKVNGASVKDQLVPEGSGGNSYSYTLQNIQQDAAIEAEFTIPVTGIRLSHSEAKLTSIGEAFQLTAEVLPELAVNKKVMWSSSNEKVAAVDDNGLVKAVSDGTAQITAMTEDGGFEAACTITVSAWKKVTGVTLDKNSLQFTAKGQKVKLNAAVSPANASEKAITWKSSNPSAATVGQDGTVTAVGNGKADITVTTKDGAFTAVCKVEINIPVLAKPDKVSGVKAGKNTVSSMKISWKPVKNADSYKVYTKMAKGKWRAAGTTKNTSLTIKRLSAGTKYSIKVAAVNKAGMGSDSKYVTTATNPQKVTLKSINRNTKTSVKLKYAQVNADGYKIYRKEGSGKYKLALTTKKTTAKVSRLKKGKTYRFKVRAYVKAGGKTYYGSYSRVKTYRAK